MAMAPLKHFSAHSALFASVLAVAACASGPNPTLQQAEGQVGALGQDAAVARYAPLEAERARQYLAEAQASAHDGADEPVVTHQAYIASQQAEIARQVAADKAAQDEVARASATLAQRQEADRLRQQLQNMQARQTERGVVLTLGNVLFQTDSANLVPGAAQHVDQLATVLRQHPDYTVEIDGYTDSTGSDTYNLGLSQRRAETVRRELALRGIDPSRLTARGHGKAAPVASNDTSAGRQMNRRVEVLVEGPGLGREQSSGAVPMAPATSTPPQNTGTPAPPK
jgi:outer membrane protein OmpA-like peptidoglycan-associated protein